jgi:hypothetical protein
MNNFDYNRGLKQLIIVLLLITFTISLVTGLIKFPELQRYFIFVYNYISPSGLSRLHDFNGLAFIGLIIIHLVVNRKYIFLWLKNTLNKNQFENGKITMAVILIAIVIVGIILFLFISHTNQPMSLSPVEIKDYNSEKLGSINDFRENSIKGPQYIDKNSYRLEITGLVSTSTSYGYDDILKLPAYQKVVTLNCVEGWSVKALWEGVLVKDLLKNVTIKPEAKTVIFYAADGYSTSFPLDYILQNNIIMANKLNGLILPPREGFPFQLVAEQKWGYKWIKWITKIELSSDTNYKGFWESRGYNNNGDLNGSKFSQ